MCAACACVSFIHDPKLSGFGHHQILVICKSKVSFCQQAIHLTEPTIMIAMGVHVRCECSFGFELNFPMVLQSGVMECASKLIR